MIKLLVILAQYQTPYYPPTISPQPGPIGRDNGYVIQQPGRAPIYVNPIPGPGGRGNYWIHDLNKGPDGRDLNPPEDED